MYKVAVAKKREVRFDSAGSCDFTNRGRNLAMAMVADSYPKLKSFLRNCGVSETSRSLVVRMVIAFILHYGRMSCSQADGVLPTDERNKAQLTRFLARPRWNTVKSSRWAAEM